MHTLTQFNLSGIERYLINMLGSDPIDKRAQKYVDVLNGIGIKGVRNFIISLLHDGIPTSIIDNSYFHPNKFFKLGICRISNCVKLRLHFWNKNQLEAKTPIHSHAWDFASFLISGSYLHETFQVKDLNESEAAFINHLQTSDQMNAIPDQYLGMYRIPKRDEASGKYQPEFIKYVRTERLTSKIENQGSTYFLDMQYPHQITIDLKNIGSMITLVIASETNRENLYTLQPVSRSKTFDNPSPNVNESIVRSQLEIILQEIDRIKS